MSCEAKGCKNKAEQGFEHIRLCHEHREIMESRLDMAKDIEAKIKCPECGYKIQLS